MDWQRAPPDLRLRWLIFALAAGAFWLSFFHRVAPAAIAADLQSSFGIGGAMLGALAATYYVVYMVMQVPTGVLNDTLGPRRVLTAGCVVAGAGSILFGMAGSALAAAAGRTLVGLGVSVVFVSMLKLNANWFHERRFATVTGLGGMIGLTGALAAAAPLAWLATHTSWRNVFVALGAASLLLAAAIWSFVRDGPVDPVLPKPALKQRWQHGVAIVARNPGTWPCFWVGFGMSGSYMTFVGLWGVPYLMHAHGRSVIEATQHTTVAIIASALSQAGIGALSDRIARRRPILVGSALLYLVCWIVWLTELAAFPGASWMLCALMGLTLGGFTLSWSCAKEVNPPRLAGTAISLVNMSGFLAVGLLQPLFGWLLDRGAAGAPYVAAHYVPGVALLAACAFLGFVAALFIRETHCRNIWVERPLQRTA